MNPWEQLLAVQQHDTVLDQLEHRARSIPERRELDELAGEQSALGEETAARSRRQDELLRSQRRLEDEISSLGTPRDETNAKLYGGSVSAPKELAALQDEIRSIERRVGALEDEILEIMVLLEPVNNDLETLAARRGELEQRVTTLQAAVTAQEGEIEIERSEVQGKRSSALAGVDSSLLERYEKARAQLGGVAVARLTAGKCDGCHLTLSAVEVDRIKHLSVDEPVTCEECGRYLVRG